MTSDKVRQEWIVCACTGVQGEEDTTWCGRNGGVGFAFVDAGHAARNGKREGRLVLCRDCRDAIVRALDNGADGEPR